MKTLLQELKAAATTTTSNINNNNHHSIVSGRHLHLNQHQRHTASGSRHPIQAAAGFFSDWKFFLIGVYKFIVVGNSLRNNLV
jgi:hypothetical protein